MSVKVKMSIFLQIGLHPAGVLCFVSFESMDHLLLHFPFIFWGIVLYSIVYSFDAHERGLIFLAYKGLE